MNDAGSRGLLHDNNTRPGLLTLLHHRRAKLHQRVHPLVLGQRQRHLLRQGLVPEHVIPLQVSYGLDDRLQVLPRRVRRVQSVGGGVFVAGIRRRKTLHLHFGLGFDRRLQHRGQPLLLLGLGTGTPRIWRRTHHSLRMSHGRQTLCTDQLQRQLFRTFNLVDLRLLRLLLLLLLLLLVDLVLELPDLLLEDETQPSLSIQLPSQLCRGFVSDVDADDADRFRGHGAQSLVRRFRRQARQDYLSLAFLRRQLAAAALVLADEPLKLAVLRQQSRLLLLQGVDVFGRLLQDRGLEQRDRIVSSLIHSGIRCRFTTGAPIGRPPHRPNDAVSRPEVFDIFKVKLHDVTYFYGDGRVIGEPALVVSY